MATQTDHLDSLRQQADQIKEDIKQKRKECRDTTMQQVSTPNLPPPYLISKKKTERGY